MFNAAIVAPPPCSGPSNLSATNIWDNGAVLEWIENGSATAWDIQYGPAGFTLNGTNSTLVTGTNNPYVLTGLSASTAYEFYVRGSCGASNGISYWIGPYAFTTASENSGSGSSKTANNKTSPVQDSGLDNISVHPNPSGGIFNIEFNGTQKIEMTLFDIYGKVLKSNFSTSKLDLTAYQAGIYLLRIDNTETGKQVIKRLVVSK